MLKTFSRGLHFIKENPQLWYTISLIILIPFAFLYVAERFLDTSAETQERIERDRISLMHDTAASLLPSFIQKNDKDTLQRFVQKTAEEDDGLISIRIVSESPDGFVIIASSDTRDLNTIDSQHERLYQGSRIDKENSVIFQEYDGLARHWRAVRAIPETDAVIFTDFSMERIDSLAQANVRSAYVVLIFILLLIFILILRHARIIDYASLYKELEKLDKLKDDFVTVAAHELRTPLTVIRGYIDLFNPEHLSGEEQKRLSRIDSSAHQLELLINDILDVARIQSGRIQYESRNLNVSEVVGKIVEEMSSAAAEKDLLLTHSSQDVPPISADPDRLRQVLVNLVGNSIKYTKEGHITVRTYAEKGRVYIRVSDTGIGISAENQQQLFEKFFRVKSEKTQEIRGTGLGLWISGQLTRKMSGTIGVESIEGKGTDVVVSFPAVALTL